MQTIEWEVFTVSSGPVKLTLLGSKMKNSHCYQTRQGVNGNSDYIDLCKEGKRGKGVGKERRQESEANGGGRERILGKGGN